jgi:hypothetical protein
VFPSRQLGLVSDMLFWSIEIVLYAAKKRSIWNTVVCQSMRLPAPSARLCLVGSEAVRRGKVVVDD